MSKNTKNLSLSLVKKQDASKYKEKRRIFFDDNVKLDIDVKFRPSKKEEVIRELVEAMQEYEKSGNKVDMYVIGGLLSVLIIKHFTSIDTNAEGYKGLLEMLQLLNDGDYTGKILSSFDREELQSVFDEAAKSFEMASQVMNEFLDQNNSLDNGGENVDEGSEELQGIGEDAE